MMSAIEGSRKKKGTIKFPCYPYVYFIKLLTLYVLMITNFSASFVNLDETLGKTSILLYFFLVFKFSKPLLFNANLKSLKLTVELF